MTDNETRLHEDRPKGKKLMQTIIRLQRHTEWVSAKNARAVQTTIAGKPRVELIGGVLRENGGQAYVAHDGDAVVVAFRGTGGGSLKKTVKNACKDANIRSQKWGLGGIEAGRVHQGFYREYERFREAILTRVRGTRTDHVFVTGFSLGAALATLCAFDLRVNEKLRVTAILFASPRVGGPRFRRAFEKHVKNACRVTMDSKLTVTGDPVPRVPVEISGITPRYIHVGPLLQITTAGKQVPPERIKANPPRKASVFVARFAWFHKREKYREALQKLAKKVEDSGGFRSWASLNAAAKAERRATPSLNVLAKLLRLFDG